jgi:hypothetical protein
MSDTGLAHGDDATITRQAKAGFIRDDRGRKVTQLDPVKMRLLRRAGEMDRTALDAICEEIGTGFSIRINPFVPLFIGGACLFLFVAVITTLEVVRSGDFSEILSGRNIVLANIWFWPFMIWRFARRHRFGKIRAAMLKHRHCPHCAYALRGLRPDESDGATVCPECGCAWMLPGHRLDEDPVNAVT